MHTMTKKPCLCQAISFYFQKKNEMKREKRTFYIENGIYFLLCFPLIPSRGQYDMNCASYESFFSRRACRKVTKNHSICFAFYKITGQLTNMRNKNFKENGQKCRKKLCAKKTKCSIYNGKMPSKKERTNE